MNDNLFGKELVIRFTLSVFNKRSPMCVCVCVVVVVLLFNVHGKHLRSCRDGQLTLPHFSLAGSDLLSG